MYHPDRVEGLGIELRELAERKAKEVNNAYATAKQQRRFK
jgi:DnaJ-class molecular chaperone